MSTSCGLHSDMLHSKSTQKNRRKSDIIYKEKGLRGEKCENTADTAAYDLYSGGCRIFNKKDTYHRSSGTEEYQ